MRSRRIGIFLETVSVVLALCAHTVGAAGINLSWDDCGTHGTANKTFACNTTTGSDRLVASFVPPGNINRLLGLEGDLDVQTTGAALPDWWKHGVGQCRGTTGISVSFDFTSGPFSCLDPWSGQATGAFAYEVGYLLPNRARLIAQGAVQMDLAAPLDSTAEYYGFIVNFLHTNATGVGACTGCSDPAFLTLVFTQLFQPATDHNDPQLAVPIHGTTVTWQGQSPFGTTAVQHRSLGQLKHLYR